MARIKTYSKDTNITGKEKVIGSDIDGTTLNYEIDELRDYIGGATSIQDKIVSGRATWFELMKYTTTQIIAIIGGVMYDIDSTVQTLDAAPTTVGYKRYDIITAKVSADGLTASINVIKGQEAENPPIPTVPYAHTEIVITTVSISYGSTAPDGVSNILVYDELAGEPTEFAVTENSGGSGITLNNTEHPNTGTINMKVNYALLDLGDLITMSTSTDLQLSEISSLDFYVYLGTEISGKSAIAQDLRYISIKIYDGATQLGSEVRVRDGVYGLDTTLVEEHQLISIPMSQFTAYSGLTSIPDYALNKITLGFIGDISTEIFLDTFKLTSGVITPPTLQSYLNLEDTYDDDYIGKEGFSPVVTGEGLFLKRTVQFRDLYAGNAIINGGWAHVVGSNQDYYLWASAYIINGVLYSNESDFVSGTVTLTVAPNSPNQRIDLMIIDSNSTEPPTHFVSVIEGTEGVSPVDKPNIDLTSQVEISFKLLTSDETTPPEVNTEIAYDENIEWTNHLASTLVDTASTVSPHSGSLNTYIPKSSSSSPALVGWTRSSAYPYSSDTMINFALITPLGWSNDGRIELKLLLAGSPKLVIHLDSNNISNYGYNATAEAWFPISIPINSLSLIQFDFTEYDEIEFKFTDLPEVRIDLVHFQGGLTQPPSGDNKWTDLTDTDNNYIGKAGFVPTVNDKENGLVLEVLAQSTGLEALDEGNGIGWRLIGKDPLNYGNIGLGAADFSYSSGASNVKGALGSYDFAINEGVQHLQEDNIGGGFNFFANGINTLDFNAGANMQDSTILGRSNTVHIDTGGSINSLFLSGTENQVYQSDSAGGDTLFVTGDGNTVYQRGFANYMSGKDNILGINGSNSQIHASVVTGRDNTLTVVSYGTGGFVGGRGNFARSAQEFSIGQYGTDYTAANDNTDRIFNIGTGTGTSTRSDALTVYKNGATTFHPVAEPTNPEAGMVYFDSTSNKLRCYNGTIWNDLF